LISNKLLALLSVACLVGVITANGDSLVAYTLTNWEGLLLWGTILLVVNLFPVHMMAGMTLTLDMPILLAIAILYPPEVAATVALVGVVDVREFSRQVSFTRATWNRSQIALCVFLAGVTFHSIAPSLDSWSVALSGTAVALATFHVANVLLVSWYTALRWRRSVPLILRQMTVGKWPEFLATYFGYGALALILAFLYQNLGGWSVVLFLAPLLVARQALVREQRVQRLAQRLRERERLLKKLFDRMADERKDERTRIAYDLHDDVLQSLIRVSQLGGFIHQEIDPPAQLSKDIEELTRLSRDAGEKVRRVIRGLELSGVGGGGLVATLSGLARDLETRWRIKIHLDVRVVHEVPSNIELCVYQITKEGLENSMRYSEATEVQVSLAEIDGELHVTITDNGVGFEVDRVDRSSHFGLGILEARTRLAGGTLKVTSSLGDGTRVEASLPLKETKPEELSLNSSGFD
jgi:NarL family two-component system sensor histidine kinase LiaS